MAVILKDRPLWLAIRRGAVGKCPNCGQGKIFRKFLKNHTECNHCQTDFSHHRADDAPAYLTIAIVGHITIYGLLHVEINYEPEPWIQLVTWLPVAAILSFMMIQPLKGALIGLQWAKYMHGFNPAGDANDPN